MKAHGRHCTTIMAVALGAGVAGCGTDINTLLLQAVGSTGRAYLDLFLTDVANEVADRAESADDGAGDVDDGGPADGDGGGDGDTGDLTGNADDGEALFVASNCGACHCDDASGACLLDAPALAGTSAQAIADFTDGTESHAGGVADLSNQDVADLEAWLASLE